MCFLFTQVCSHSGGINRASEKERRKVADGGAFWFQLHYAWYVSISWSQFLFTETVFLGTVFMARLQEQLKYFVTMKITTDELWQGIRIYLSGHDVNVLWCLLWAEIIFFLGSWWRRAQNHGFHSIRAFAITLRSYYAPLLIRFGCWFGKIYLDLL